MDDYPLNSKGDYGFAPNRPRLALTGLLARADLERNRPLVPIPDSNVRNWNSVVMRRVGLSEALPLLGQFLEWINRRSLTYGDACSAIDAAHRINEHLGCLGESRFVLTWVDAIHRTDIHTLFVFGAIGGDDVSHFSFFSLSDELTALNVIFL